MEVNVFNFFSSERERERAPGTFSDIKSMWKMFLCPNWYMLSDQDPNSNKVQKTDCQNGFKGVLLHYIYS